MIPPKYTPGDITKSEFTQNDFLYAGWLYGSLGIVSDTGQVFDNIVLTLGMVGPSSKAQQSQEYIHHVIESPQPQGWDHQLERRTWDYILLMSINGANFLKQKLLVLVWMSCLTSEQI